MLSPRSFSGLSARLPPPVTELTVPDSLTQALGMAPGQRPGAVAHDCDVASAGLAAPDPTQRGPVRAPGRGLVAQGAAVFARITRPFKDAIRTHVDRLGTAKGGPGNFDPMPHIPQLLPGLIAIAALDL